MNQLGQMPGYGARAEFQCKKGDNEKMKGFGKRLAAQPTSSKLEREGTPDDRDLAHFSTRHGRECARAQGRQPNLVGQPPVVLPVQARRNRPTMYTVPKSQLLSCAFFRLVHQKIPTDPSSSNQTRPANAERGD